MGPYDAARPLLFSLPAETAHRWVHRLLRTVQRTPLRRALAARYTVADDRLRTEAFGQSFPNPVGVAAGFDKNAHLPPALRALGFGFVEVGGVTAQPQAGNARPRLFRLREDEALVNRMGLNNDGAAAVGDRIAALDVGVPVGVNVAKSSCPNSQGFEELQNREAMADIFAELTGAGASPLLVKLSPDLPEPAVADALELVGEFGLDGVVATNTSTDRPDSLRSPNRSEQGGLSGKPVEERATRMVRFVAERVDVPVVGVGGVATAEDAYEKVRAGASVVQLYTALVYEGPSVARDINRGLLDLLERDGFDSVEEAVGADL